MNWRTRVRSGLRAASALRSFVMRVAVIATVLAVPILGTSYVMVSHISQDIAQDAAEHVALTDFIHVIDLVATVEHVHERLASKDATSTALIALTGRHLAAAHAAYAAHREPTQSPEADVMWKHAQTQWERLQRAPTAAHVDALFETLDTIGKELDDTTQLDVDPDIAVQNLAATMLREEPRSILGLSRTGDAIAQARGPTIGPHAAERIAQRRALEDQALSRGFSDIEIAGGLRPALQPHFAAAVARAQATTTAYERRVDTMLATLVCTPSDAREIEAASRAAVAAHIALWRIVRREADAVIVARFAGNRQHRRAAIGLALIAVIAGALAIVAVGRYEARRDRLQLAAVKLEADNLRTELSHATVERALRLQEAQFRTVFENADLGIVTFDRRADVLRFNGAVEHMLGAALTRVLDGVKPDVRLFADPHEPFTRDEHILDDAGRPRWLALTLSGVYDEGVCQMVIVLVRDVTEEKLLAQQLAYDASHDSLTGIANRAAFERALHDELQNAGHAPFALAYIDLDKFKPINDSFGHRAGDHVLVTIAERLRSAVGPDDVCARLGGDEFAIILRGIGDSAALGSIAQRLLASAAAPIAYKDAGVSLEVTASLGIAVASSQHTSTDRLKHDADLALYAVKERGRNGYLIHQRPIAMHAAAVSGLA